MKTLLQNITYKFILLSYNISFYISSALAFLSSFFLPKKHKEKVKQALLTDNFKINPNKKYIWIHGTSYGEILSGKSLVESIIQEYGDDVEVVITCELEVNMIKSIFNHSIECRYLPLGCGFLVEKFLAIYNPVLIIFLERFFYPVIVEKIKKRNTPFLLFNAVVPMPSFLMWKKIGFVLRFMLDAFDEIYPMSIYNKRIIDVINKKDNRYIGNIKYTNLKTREQIASKYANKIKYLSGLFQGYYILTAHCIHIKELKIIIELHKQLNSKGFKVKIIIIPRRRIRKMFNSLTNMKVDLTLFSEIFHKKTASDIILVDSMGATQLLCYLSDFTFIGKSLYLKGGHNLLEPLSMGSPVIFGKNMHFFKDVVKSTLKHNAGIEISTEEELLSSVVYLFSNPELLAELKENSNFVHEKSRNVLEHFQKEVFKYLS